MVNNTDNLTYINFLKNYGCQTGGGGHGKQLAEKEFDVSWTVYPNPSNSSFTIDLQLSTDLTTDLRIFDITGKEVLKIYEHNTLTKGRYPIKVNDEQLPAGVYICQLKYEDETGQEQRDYLKLVKTQ
ncbi:MAG: T9SS type A sorting domain-containing protein [Chitinophagales bacterium]